MRSTLSPLSPSRATGLVAAVCLIALASGCAGRGGGLLRRATITHPMTSGGIAAAPPLAFEDNASERHLGIPPGALRDEATLVRADAEQVCVDLTLRVDQNEQEWSNLAAYRIQLLSSESEVPVENPMVSPRPTQGMQYAGHRYEDIPTGATTTYCVSHDQYNNCLEYRTDPVMQTITVPTTWTVFEGGGMACFANAGVLTPATTFLRLRVVDPRNPGGRAGVFRVGVRVGMNYEWELAGAQQQVARNQ